MGLAFVISSSDWNRTVAYHLPIMAALRHFSRDSVLQFSLKIFEIIPDKFLTNFSDVGDYPVQVQDLLPIVVISLHKSVPETDSVNRRPNFSAQKIAFAILFIDCVGR